jgi:type IV pilus assembly protein PilM
MSFFATKIPFFGFDVSAGSMKLMQLKKEGSAQAISAYAEAALPKGLVINDTISDTKTFLYLLKQAMDRPRLGQFTTHQAVVSLPESKSFVRVIQIPQMSEKEASSAIPFEAESFIPMPIDQVYLDWQKLDIQDDKMNILIIATPKDFVDKYLNLLDEAGIKPLAMEVESQSCHRALLDQKLKETVLIADIQAARTSLIMVEEGHLQFTSSIPVAGNAFTEALARSLGISSSKAEELKKRIGLANTPENPNIKTALLPVLNSLLAEIKNILKFHNDHSTKKVTRLLLAGGSAQINNLLEFLSPEFQSENIKVELANPMLHLAEHSKPKSWQGAEALAYTTVIGLALRPIKNI